MNAFGLDWLRPAVLSRQRRRRDFREVCRWVRRAGTAAGRGDPKAALHREHILCVNYEIQMEIRLGRKQPFIW